MAVKLSSWLWMRNNDLEPIVKEEFRARNMYMTDEHRKELGRIIDEMDDVVSFEDQVVDRPFVGENVALPGYIEIVQSVRDVGRYASLLEDVHGVMRNYLVQPEFYRRLGQAFAENGARPSPDTKKAIDYGTKLEEYYNASMYSRTDRMCWGSHVAYEKQKMLRKTADDMERAARLSGR